MQGTPRNGNAHRGRKPPITPGQIREALRKFKGSPVKAARSLGMARNTFATRVAQIGIKMLMAIPEQADAGREIQKLVNRSHEYDLSILTKETWNQPRGCFRCGKQFTPKRKQDWKSHFCESDCRKLYYFTPANYRTGEKNVAE